MRLSLCLNVIPAKAGIHFRTCHMAEFEDFSLRLQWIPAFAGMTTLGLFEVSRIGKHERRMGEVNSTCANFAGLGELTPPEVESS